jgi:hypothetical protein
MCPFKFRLPLSNMCLAFEGFWGKHNKLETWFFFSKVEVNMLGQVSNASSLQPACCLF